MNSYTIAYVHGIARIHVFPKYLDTQYEVIEYSYRTGFFFKKTVSGVFVYDRLNLDRIPLEKWHTLSASKNTYIEDNRIYFMPHVDIVFVDGKTKSQFFDNAEELYEFADQIQRMAPYVLM